MGLQLIFVVETNKKSKSDWIYVKDTVDYFYKYERTEVKFSPIYMEGRGKYNSPKKQREIEQKDLPDIHPDMVDRGQRKLLNPTEHRILQSNQHLCHLCKEMLQAGKRS